MILNVIEVATLMLLYDVRRAGDIKSSSLQWIRFFFSQVNMPVTFSSPQDNLFALNRHFRFVFSLAEVNIFIYRKKNTSRVYRGKSGKYVTYGNTQIDYENISGRD